MSKGRDRMKSNSKPEDNEPMESLMQEWRLEAPLPPRFQEQVWQRIARAEAQPQTTVWVRLTRLVEVLLPRPKVAFAYVAALVVFGMAAGSVIAQIRTSHVEAALGARYVQSVNPYQAEVPQP